MYRTYGARDFALYLFPALAGWANVWRTYGAFGRGWPARRARGAEKRCRASRHTSSGPPARATGTQKACPTIRGSFDFAQDKKAPSRLRAGRRYEGSREDKDRVTSGMEGRSRRPWVPEAKRDFSHPQADAFAGANAEEESRPAPFEMTVNGVGGVRKRACSLLNDGWRRGVEGG